MLHLAQTIRCRLHARFWGKFFGRPTWAESRATSTAPPSCSNSRAPQTTSRRFRCTPSGSAPASRSARRHTWSRHPRSRVHPWPAYIKASGACAECDVMWRKKWPKRQKSARRGDRLSLELPMHAGRNGSIYLIPSVLFNSSASRYPACMRRLAATFLACGS